jgi:hypothetical protein
VFKLDVKPPLKEVRTTLLGRDAGLADMMVYTGYTSPFDSMLIEHMERCNPRGPFIIHMVSAQAPVGSSLESPTPEMIGFFAAVSPSLTGG